MFVRWLAASRGGGRLPVQPLQRRRGHRDASTGPGSATLFIPECPNCVGGLRHGDAGRLQRRRHCRIAVYRRRRYLHVRISSAVLGCRRSALSCIATATAHRAALSPRPQLFFLKTSSTELSQVARAAAGATAARAGCARRGVRSAGVHRFDAPAARPCGVTAASTPTRALVLKHSIVRAEQVTSDVQGPDLTIPLAVDSPGRQIDLTSTVRTQPVDHLRRLQTNRRVGVFGDSAVAGDYSRWGGRLRCSGATGNGCQGRPTYTFVGL